MSRKFAVWAIDAVSLALLALLAIPTAILAALMGLIWDCADKLTHSCNFKRSFLNNLRNLAEIAFRAFFKRGMNNARA